METAEIMKHAIVRMGFIGDTHIVAANNEEQNEFLSRVSGKASIKEVVDKGYIFYQMFWNNPKVTLHLTPDKISLAKKNFPNNPLKVFLYNKYFGLNKVIEATSWSGLSFDNLVVMEGIIPAAYADEYGFLGVEDVHIGKPGEDHVILAHELGYDSLEAAILNGMVRYSILNSEIQIEMMPSKSAKNSVIKFLRKQKMHIITIDWVNRKGVPIWTEKSKSISDALIHIMRFGDA